MAELRQLLHLDAPTVSGETVRENIAGAEIVNSDVIGTIERPLGPGGSLVVLYGSLCPDGAVMKTSAAKEHLLQHKATQSSSRTSTTWPRAWMTPNFCVKRPA